MIDNQSLSVQAEINRIETKETAHKLAGIDNVGLDLSEIPPPQTENDPQVLIHRNCDIIDFIVTICEFYWNHEHITAYTLTYISENGKC